MLGIFYRFIVRKRTNCSVKMQMGGGWGWVRWGKIKCGAKALAFCVGLHLF
jgi:hypothetical protein